MSLDVAALRTSALADFKAHAATYFAAHPAAQSLVLAVAQYWADEADDAVHADLVAYPTREPWWPHMCAQEEVPGDGASCAGCLDGEGLWFRSLESNNDAVFAWSGFCSESGASQDQGSYQSNPLAIARRVEGSAEAEVEEVHHLVRPWMDRNDVGSHREDSGGDWGNPAPAPEPVRAPWSSRERQLLDAVLQHPLEAGPRQVLIDHWLENNDVRGEFGALSFAPPTTREARERRDALAAEHGRAWVGPLQPAISLAGAHFARGPFVSRAVVSFADQTASLQTRHVDEWALLEAIRFVGERQDFNANMRGLREVTGVNMIGLRSLLATQLPPTIEVLGVTEGIDDEVWSEEALWSTSLANVDTLIIEDLSVAAGPELTEPAMFPKLRTLEVWYRSEPGQFERWRDQRAFESFSTMTPLLRPGLNFSMGYQLQNGARGGVVTSTTIGSGEIRFEDRQFASAAEHERARACFNPQQQAQASDARPTPVRVTTPGSKKPGLFGRLLSIFRPPG